MRCKKHVWVQAVCTTVMRGHIVLEYKCSRCAKVKYVRQRPGAWVPS